MNIRSGRLIKSSMDAVWVGNNKYLTMDNRFTVELNGGSHYTISAEDENISLIPETFWLIGGPLDGYHT